MTENTYILAVGFTGTQAGMSLRQIAYVTGLLQDLKAQGYKKAHHGDCVGADAEFDEIARQVGFEIVIHPPENPVKRAFCHRRGACLVLAAKPYLVRNHDLVDSVSLLIATPRTETEEIRSGTWATVRYARRKNVTVEIIPPR